MSAATTRHLLDDTPRLIQASDGSDYSCPQCGGIEWMPIADAVYECALCGSE